MKAFAGSRVLMLLENSRYPRDNRVPQEAATLVRHHYSVTVISPGAPDQAWHEVLLGVQVYRFPAPRAGASFLGYLWEYGYSMAATFLLSVLVLVRHGFDVVHAHNPPDTFVLIGAFYKLLGKWFIFDHHDLSPEMYAARFGGGNRWVRRGLIFFERLSCRLADRVIATNESYKALEIERTGIPPDRITVVRNGPNLERVRVVAGDDRLCRMGKTIFAYVGVMGFQDGLDYLLRALHHLVYGLHRRDVYCVLIGQGDALPTLQKLTAELGLDEYVWFPGYVSEEDLIRYLCSADICVDPDPSNPFNDRSTMIKMMEYMALSKPIVAFDLPEHRVTAAEAALYAQANDVCDFARQIALLMDDPTRRRWMGRIGRERIEQRLTWNHQEAALLKVYDGLTGRMRSARDSTAPSPPHDALERAVGLATTAENG